MLAAIACGPNADDAGARTPATAPCRPGADTALNLEYEAVTSDGHYIVTFVSMAAKSPADEEATRRIFYGVPGRMEQGRPAGVDYSCARLIGFDLDGTPCSATFAGKICGGSVPSRLDIGDGSPHAVLRLTILLGDGQPDAAAVPVDTLSYLCF